MAKRPNFLFFCTDQHQANDLGALGNSFVQTPNLDRLINEGVAMRNAITNYPSCVPARCSMFSGRYGSAMGMREFAQRRPESGMSLDTNTVARELQQAGYHTCGIGKFHVNACEVWGKEDDVTTEEYAKRGKHLPENYFGFEHLRLSARHREIMNWAHASDVAKHAPDVFGMAGPDNALAEPSGAWQSWKSAVPEEWYSTTWIADQAIDFLKGVRDPERPFFMWCSFPDPHHPMSPPKPWCDMYDPANVPLPHRREGELADMPPWCSTHMPSDRPDVTGVSALGKEGTYVHSEAFMREVRALTYGMISLVDKHCGRVIDALRESGELENTVICFTCDHGDYMGDHWLVGKGPMHYDSILRVPHFWWAPPGMIDGGRVSDALVTHTDMMPTVLEFAGIEIPWDVQGHSLRGILKGEQTDVRDAVLVEHAYSGDYMPRTARAKDFRLTRWFGRDGKVQPVGELFDLREDPYELRNVFDDPAYASKRVEMTERLLELQVEVTRCP